jgi:hypothetical protein
MEQREKDFANGATRKRFRKWSIEKKISQMEQREKN